MPRDDLNDMLNKIEKNQRMGNVGFLTNKEMRHHDSKQEIDSKVSLPTTSPVKNAGILTKIKVISLKNKKELEAAEVIFDTQLVKLKHQATAATRESQAFWDAKSVEVSESIKTYVQATLSSLENQRLVSKNDAIQQAYNKTSVKVTEIHDDESLPDMFKEKLIQELVENLRVTVERLRNNAIAQKYDLT